MDLYTLKLISLQCPKCWEEFAAPHVESMPAMTNQSKVEADMHRFLPDGAIRAALIAMCPYCMYTWWIENFVSSVAVTFFLPESPPVAPWSKFAHAVLSGRHTNEHSLDRGYMALNGYWCAKECFQPADKFLAVAREEFQIALEDDSWSGYRGRHYYQMAEILRLSGDFHNAVKYYMKVDKRALLPEELLKHQIRMAKMGDARAVTMPPHLVEKIFLHALSPHVRAKYRDQYIEQNQDQDQIQQVS